VKRIQGYRGESLV